jgi:hypothetical protein
MIVTFSSVGFGDLSAVTLEGTKKILEKMGK